MLNQIKFDNLINPVVDIYRDVETRLMLDIASRFNTYDEIGGTLEWQLQMLEELGALNASAVKLFSGISKKSDKEILKMLKSAQFSNIELSDLDKAFEVGLSQVDAETLLNSKHFKPVLEKSYKKLQNGTFKMIKTKAVESTKQAYMNILNTAYIETASGIYSYQQSIDRALQQMVNNGITGATYQRGNRTIHYSIEGTVRRDVLTAVNQLANANAMESCLFCNAEYVEISQHLGARVNLLNPIANHAGWQGHVFKINGSDNKYKNLKRETGYPDDILGLGGVNCRHRIFPFFPGISVKKPIMYSLADNEEQAKIISRQRYYERGIRKTKRQLEVGKISNAPQETVDKFKKRLDNQNKIIDKYCNDNGIRRDYDRERIFIDKVRNY